MKKALAVCGGLLYMVSPIDVIPDFIPVLGWLDDIGVLGLVIAYVTRAQEQVKTRRLRGREDD